MRRELPAATMMTVQDEEFGGKMKRDERELKT
jgi:hypothetical protein